MLEIITINFLDAVNICSLSGYLNIYSLKRYNYTPYLKLLYLGSFFTILRLLYWTKKPDRNFLI